MQPEFPRSEIHKVLNNRVFPRILSNKFLFRVLNDKTLFRILNVLGPQ